MKPSFLSLSHLTFAGLALLAGFASAVHADDPSQPRNTPKTAQDKRNEAYLRAMQDVIKSTLTWPGDEFLQGCLEHRERQKHRTKWQYTEEEVKLIRALNTRIARKFAARELRAELNALATAMDIPITLDRQALKAAAISDESPVTSDVHDVTFRSYLKKILGGVKLEYVIHDDGILVTTPERARRMLVTGAYLIDDLRMAISTYVDDRRMPTPQLGSITNLFVFAQQLVVLLAEVQGLLAEVQRIELSSWKAGGGPGIVTFEQAKMAFKITQTVEMHWLLQGRLAR